MSKWEKGVMTAKGNALLTKLHSGTTLSITRAVTGAGAVTSDELRNLTAIPDERQALAFSTKSYPEDGKIAVPLKLTNIGVTEEYKITCVGIYAMDPDEGEILYMAAKTVNGQEVTVPTPAENPSFTYVWTFYVKYGQADNVEITVDPSTAVTVEEMQAVLADHSEDTSNPHGVTAEQIGLGNVENTRDAEKYVAFASDAGTANKIKNSMVIRVNGGRTEGTDMFTYNGSAGKSINLTPEKLGVAPAIESKDYPGCYYRMVDGEVEWLNPPMVTGVEYRTTERRDGKPVYRKLVNYSNTERIGDTVGTPETIIPHGIQDFGTFVRCEATKGTYSLAYHGSNGAFTALSEVNAWNIIVTHHQMSWNPSSNWRFDLYYTK